MTLEACQTPAAERGCSAVGVAEVPGCGTQVDMTSCPGSSAPARRVIRRLNASWLMGVAVLLMWALSAAQAQTQDPRIVFAGPTAASSALERRIQISLEANNYTDCEEHVCRQEGRQPRKKKDWHLLGCYCDDACGPFGDCCRDAERAAQEARSDMTCLPLRQYTGVYVVSRCPAGWPDDQVKRMCEHGSAGNLQAEALVSDQRTGLTYRNWACAVCHSDTEHAVSWPTRLECPSAQKGQPVQLKQLGEGEWGLSQVVNGSEVVHACLVDPYMPETLADFVRTCQPMVTSCADSWPDDEVSRLCGAYTAKVYDVAIRSAQGDTHELVFRNAHCALCNGLAPEDVICTAGIGIRFDKPRAFNVQAFSILLDVVEDTGSNTVGAKTVCDEGEFWDKAFIKCRPLSCDEGFLLKGNECVAVTERITGEPRGGGGIVFPGDNSGNVTRQETSDFQRCPKVYLSDDEFVLRDDGTVVVEHYQRTFGPDEFEIRAGELAICSVSSDFRKFDDALTVMSLVFLAASVFCLCCHLVLFFLVPDLRNLSGKNLASLCLCLLVGYVCFIASPFETSGSGGCRALGIVMYTAFMASFFWMNIMAFDVFVTLRLVTGCMLFWLFLNVKVQIIVIFSCPYLHSFVHCYFLIFKYKFGPNG